MRGRTGSYRAGRTGVLGFLAACIVAICHAPAAHAQAIYLGLDTQAPHVSTNRVGSSDVDIGREGLPFWVNWHARSYLDQEGNHRFGFAVRRSKVTVAYPDRGDEYPFSRTSFQLTLDRMLVRSDRWLLTAGAGLGWSFISENFYGGNPDAAQWFPDACWVLTPELRIIYDSKLPVSGFVSFRGSLLVTDRDTAYPFESGPIVSLGLLVH